MGYRRKRKQRGTWFPVLGNNAGPEGEDLPVAGIYASIPVPHAGNISTVVSQLTYDTPKEEVANQADGTSLADVIGSAWSLRRIVGKLWCERTTEQLNAMPLIKVGVGFFVARAAGNDDSTTSNLPVGYGSVSDPYDQVRGNNYSPLSMTTQREPWIWRRVWVLGGGVSEGIPNINWTAQSALDGPHIDAKTRRIIASDNRLWVAFSAVLIPPQRNESSPLAEYVDFHLDYRLFGFLRRSRNQGAF